DQPLSVELHRAQARSYGAIDLCMVRACVIDAANTLALKAQRLLHNLLLVGARSRAMKPSR
ncbi:hypothetical protein, partial [Xanthomonas campestris]|uniref:hypothetical protein n=1 Tax=Xanthomonas campestris TaxID=339 RepID=UPI002B22329A